MHSNEERLSTQRIVGDPGPERQLAAPLLAGGSAQWGLASLLMGGVLLITSAITLVFNVLFLSQAYSMRLAMSWITAGSLLALASVGGLTVAGLVFGILGWRSSYAQRQTPALALAGSLTCLVALVAWLVVGIDLIAILISLS